MPFRSEPEEFESLRCESNSYRETVGPRCRAAIARSYLVDARIIIFLIMGEQQLIPTMFPAYHCFSDAISMNE